MHVIHLGGISVTAMNVEENGATADGFVLGFIVVKCGFESAQRLARLLLLPQPLARFLASFLASRLSLAISPTSAMAQGTVADILFSLIVVVLACL